MTSMCLPSRIMLDSITYVKIESLGISCGIQLWDFVNEWSLLFVGMVEITPGAAMF